MRKRVLLSALSAIVAVLPAYAQRRADTEARAVTPPPSATVSVSSLAVTADAREHYHLAVDANRAHREEECDREIAKALEKMPQFPEALLLRGVREINRHEYDAAISDVLAAQQGDGSLVWAPVALSQAYNGLGRYQDALVILENVRGAAFGSWQEKYERARAEVGLHRAEDAVYWSAQALAVVPQTFVDAHLVYANALQLAERWSDASSELRLYLASSNPQAHRAEALNALAFAENKARKNTPDIAAAQ